MDRLADELVMATVAFRRVALDEPERAGKAWRELVRLLKETAILIFRQPRREQLA